MRLLDLASITIRNFRCFADEITVTFPAEAGLCFLTGVNMQEPLLGSNGAGKSSIFDALYWCLYNVSIRGQRAADLANWTNGGRPQVIVTLYADGVEHSIDRTGTPDALVLDGMAATQAQIDTLLGLTDEQFLHSVIFGQAAPLFMDLSVPERGELLGEVCRLDIWEDMAEYAGREAGAADRRITEIEREHAESVGRIRAVLDQLESLGAQERKWQQEQQTRISIANRAYEDADHALRRAEQERRAVEAKLTASPIDRLDQEIAALAGTTHDLYMRCADADREHRAILDDLDFLGRTVCPSCGQEISPHYAAARSRTLAQDRQRAEDGIVAAKQRHQDARNGQARLRAERDAAARQEQDLRRRLVDASAEYACCQQVLVDARRRSDEARAGINPFTHEIDRLDGEAATLDAAVRDLDSQLAELTPQRDRLHYWRTGFRQVRLFLLKRTLRVLDVETAAAAAQLGVGQWRISFDTETLTKRGTARPGIFIHAANPQGRGDYRSYSFGETQRIKLAVSLGFASLIQSMAGVYYGAEMWDEPTEHLSTEGIDDLVECLRDRARATQRCIWLADHRVHGFPFDHVFQVTKQHAGSQIERIA